MERHIGCGEDTMCTNNSLITTSEEIRPLVDNSNIVAFVRDQVIEILEQANVKIDKLECSVEIQDQIDMDKAELQRIIAKETRDDIERDNRHRVYLKLYFRSRWWRVIMEKDIPFGEWLKKTCVEDYKFIFAHVKSSE